MKTRKIRWVVALMLLTLSTNTIIAKNAEAGLAIAAVALTSSGGAAGAAGAVVLSNTLETAGNGMWILGGAIGIAAYFQWISCIVTYRSCHYSTSSLILGGLLLLGSETKDIVRADIGEDLAQKVGDGIYTTNQAKEIAEDYRAVGDFAIQIADWTSKNPETLEKELTTNIGCKPATAKYLLSAVGVQVN